jgi:hypothetical protein
MLFGRLPFTAAHPVELVTVIRNSPVQCLLAKIPVSERSGESEMRSLLSCILQVSPAERIGHHRFLRTPVVSGAMEIVRQFWIQQSCTENTAFFGVTAEGVSIDEAANESAVTTGSVDCDDDYIIVHNYAI